MVKGQFNVNIPRAVSEFESAVHHFQIKRIIYKLIFRGKGLEFDSYRDFGQDEDASMIDWKASMRSGGRLLAKQYVEERDLKIWFAIDVSDNMVFGSTKQLKCEYAAEIFAALAHLIMVSDDKVGIILFSNDIVKIVNPKKGMKHFEGLVREVVNSSNYGGACDMKKMVKFLVSYLHKTTNAVFIISDFLHFNKETLKFDYLLASRFETIAVVVRDPLDEKLPDLSAQYVLEDPQTGRQILIDSKLARKNYEKNALKQKKEIEQIFKRTNMDPFFIHTDKSFVLPLVTFLNSRLRQKKIITPRM